MRRIAPILALFGLCPLAAQAGDLPVSATVQVTSAGIPILIVARPSFGVIDPLVLRQTSTSLPAGYFDLRAVPLVLRQAIPMVRHRSRLDADSIDGDTAAADSGRDGARHAVRDTMADHRRTGPPRHFMDALLVLRIDGYSDSPTLNVGGGVAGALWQVSQQR